MKLSDEQIDDINDRGWRWASSLTGEQRDDPISALMDTINALRARLAEVERERDELREQWGACKPSPWLSCRQPCESASMLVATRQAKALMESDSREDQIRGLVLGLSILGDNNG